MTITENGSTDEKINSHLFAENQYISLELIDGILIGRYKDNVKVDLETAKKIVDFRLGVTNGKSYPSIVFPNNVKYVDKEARNYFFTDKGVDGLDAIAIITADKIINIILYFVFCYSPPKKPTKVFTNTQDALQWLEQFKK